MASKASRFFWIAFSALVPLACARHLAGPGASEENHRACVERAKGDEARCQPGCSAAADQCCREDGRIGRPCGPVTVGPCDFEATCRGSDGYCFPCKCLPGGTLIATPEGEVAVGQLVPGMAIESTGPHGERVVARVSRVVHYAVMGSHRAVEVALADGRRLKASAPHPLSDGRSLGELEVGDEVDGSRVVEKREVPFPGNFAWDLLPDGPTGVYFAGRVPLRSTLWAPSR